MGPRPTWIRTKIRAAEKVQSRFIVPTISSVGLEEVWKAARHQHARPDLVEWFGKPAGVILMGPNMNLGDKVHVGMWRPYNYDEIIIHLVHWNYTACGGELNRLFMVDISN